ncbi:PREDICTED: UPF0481 protein At3g47200-like [Camelina sativa]|uniref:UPF0481 protein At3g47200-like n=1 Tax=Camelina sativa TaxID=90675 RepID=A0ABM1REG1_CAMSA|nr:PREDICTED: UPF0481 protein At3g47200-like [Camelina sativa]
MDAERPKVAPGSQTIVDREDSLLLKNVIRPTILRKSSTYYSCSIFRIRHTTTQTNDTTYAPKILSIGPYHHDTDKKHLQMIEEHKQLYLTLFVTWTQERGVGLSDLVDVVWGLEEKIRDSYSETLPFNKQELTDLMVLDGCFILMLFMVASRNYNYEIHNDPIFMLRWILPTLQRDLLLLENQVPLFLLNDLLMTSKLAPSTSVNKMAFKFFNSSIRRPLVYWDKHINVKASHLLDLIRQALIPGPSSEALEQSCINITCDSVGEIAREIVNDTCLSIRRCCSKRKDESFRRSSHYVGLIVSAKKLRQRGIKFKLRGDVDTPLDICFNKGLLEIPLLVIDDFFSTLLSNSVAFEQYNMSYSTEMTSYVTFMSCLINTEEDTMFLCEKGIIENYTGTSEEVTLFFKNVGKNLAFSPSRSFMAEVFDGVNNFKKPKTPWRTISSSAALILLLLTMIQAFFAAFAYFHPPRY